MPSLAPEPDWSITNTLGFPEFCHQAILAQPKNLAYPKAVAQFLAQYQDAGIAALALTPNLETAQDFISQHYVGCYQSLADYALEYCGITDQDQPSPDLSRFGQDHREGENTFIHCGEDGVHIFVTT